MQDDLFPDYEPKNTPDTIYDYNKTPTEVISILKEIGEPKLENLKKILELFKRYKKEAEENPGHYEDGNMILGAPPQEYIPSKGELLVSELGSMIDNIIQSNSKNKIEEFKTKEGIEAQKLVFTQFTLPIWM